MKPIGVFYEVVSGMFFVRYVNLNREGGLLKQDRVFDTCDGMVDYYRDRYGKPNETGFYMINFQK